MLHSHMRLGFCTWPAFNRIWSDNSIRPTLCNVCC